MHQVASPRLPCCLSGPTPLFADALTRAPPMLSWREKHGGSQNAPRRVHRGTATKSGQLGTFLKNVQSADAVSDPQVRFLQALSSAGPTPIPKLVAASGLALGVFLKTLQTLRELGLVSVANDVVTVTQSGQERGSPLAPGP